MGDDDATRSLITTGQAGPGDEPGDEPGLVDDVLRRGSRVQGYVVEERLGSGGGGTVWLARHHLLGRPAAIKVLRQSMADSPAMVERFFREALAANLIRHPNIIDIFEFGTLEGGRPYYIMEFLPG